MPPPAPIFWKEMDENQVSYFILWPYVVKVCIISQEILVMHYVDCDSGTV